MVKEEIPVLPVRLERRLSAFWEAGAASWLVEAKAGGVTLHSKFNVDITAWDCFCNGSPPQGLWVDDGASNIDPVGRSLINLDPWEWEAFVFITLFTCFKALLSCLCSDLEAFLWAITEPEKALWSRGIISPVLPLTLSAKSFSSLSENKLSK